jgi:hypothetical protein
VEDMGLVQFRTWNVGIWLGAGAAFVRQQVKRLRAVGSEIDSRNFRTTMCLKGFPSLEVSHRLLRVGFVGSRLPRRTRSTVLHQLARQKQPAEGRQARKQGSKAITGALGHR